MTASLRSSSRFATLLSLLVMVTYPECSILGGKSADTVMEG
jgi:hypothetical protein